MMDVNDFIEFLKLAHLLTQKQKYKTEIQLHELGLQVLISYDRWHVQNVINYDDLIQQGVITVTDHFKFMTASIDDQVYKYQNRITDYDKVTDNIYIGGMPRGLDGLKELFGMGVTYIINCMSEYDYQETIDNYNGQHLQPEKIHYLWNSTTDDGFGKPKEWWQKGITFAKEAIDKNTKIFIHCAAGVNRGPSLCYAVLRCYGQSYENAYAIIKKVRPQAGMCYRTDAEIKLRELGLIK
jgi:protein-tyrosine phosphatase